ncbi:DUF4292 domain-containing protein [Reichenbachiella sp. MALMAid0571]|uniref:DUF4292 domain-containing protein n=1 Tax=Reichenbachiella sp. MALMAid0571 TaxID=3143939 RepID=UPI0032E02BEE
MNKLALPIVILLLFASCSKKFTFFNPNPNKLKIKNLEFDDLTLRTKIKYKSGLEDLKATAHIRIKKDSLIWFSLTPGLGIEAARGLITQDSIVLIDKIHKEYTILQFKDLTEKFNFNLDFHLMESILLGNMIWPVESTDQVLKEDTYYSVSKEKGDLAISHFIGIHTMKLEKLEAVSDSTQNSMHIDYSEFDLISDKIVPAKSVITIQYTSRKDGRRKISNINFDHAKIDIDSKKQKFTFEIPDKYKYVKK